MPLKQKATKSAAPSQGYELKGKVSWFGGPNDPSDSGHTALGVTTATPGIAVYNQGTLGGYWVVTFPNGKRSVFQQTDIGPAPWTGRVVDVTYSALGRAGYTEQNFPTDGQVTAIYLGKNKQAAESSAGIDTVGAVTKEVTGGGEGEDASLLSQAESAAGAGLAIGKDLLTGNFEDLGAKFALIGLQIAKDFAVGFVDLIVAPIWHWNQRTVSWYGKYVLDPQKYGDGSDDQWAFVWTAAFWGVGYAILWTDPKGKLLQPVPVHRARLGHYVRRGQVVPARRSLVKPRNVKEHTPRKPTPSVSAAVVEHVDTMVTARNRTVRVTSHGAATSDTGGTETSTPVKRVKIAKDGKIERVAKPDKATNPRKGASQASRDTSKDNSA